MAHPSQPSLISSLQIISNVKCTPHTSSLLNFLTSPVIFHSYIQTAPSDCNMLNLHKMNARRFCILRNTAHIHLSYLTVAMGETDWVKIQNIHRILRYYKVFQPSITKHSWEPNVSNYISYFSHSLWQECGCNLHNGKIIYTGQADTVTLP